LRQRRQELAKRLVEINAKKREEKVKKLFWDTFFVRIDLSESICPKNLAFEIFPKVSYLTEHFWELLLLSSKVME
jgi:hypothetical protein